MRLALKVVPIALGLLMLWHGTATGDTPSPRTAYVARVDGVINPITARYVVRSLHNAEQRQAEVFVLVLDTPGGLDTSMRRIVQGFLNARVPTVVFVAPRGARAASAGVFITASANVAAMAPGTNLGAATPVALGSDLPETLERKATNDAAAYLREIAHVRGRNAVWLEDAVRNAASAAATEALELQVVDFIVNDLEELLQKLDGRVVTVESTERTLRTASVLVLNKNMTFLERVLGFAADPTVATLLISLGSLALVSELFHPSIIVGVSGGIALALGLVGVGNLPVNWLGVGLVLTGSLLLVLELLASGWGVLGIGALACFVLGMVLLFSTYEPSLPGAPDFRVSPWVIGGLSAFMGAWILFLSVVVLRAGKIVPLPSTSAALVGTLGVVTSDLTPRGIVMLESEVWTAVGEGGQELMTGERVQVVRVDGLVLTVRKAP